MQDLEGREGKARDEGRGEEVSFETPAGNPGAGKDGRKRERGGTHTVDVEPGEMEEHLAGSKRRGSRVSSAGDSAEMRK